MRDIRAIKRRVLESKLGELVTDYEDTMSQSASALGAADRNRLDRQAQELWTAIEKVEQELKALELAPPGGDVGISPPAPADVQREVQSKLPAIDFGAVEEAVRKILKQHKAGWCPALLLFQQSAQMGGEWCGARLRELLSRETRNGLFRHIPLEFQPGEAADKMAPLRRLGQELGLDAEGQLPDGFAKSVASKLCHTLQSGNVFLVEYRRWDYLLKDTPGIIGWFLENFWRVLVRELEQAVRAKELSRVTIIVPLFVDGPLPDHCLAPQHVCTQDEFDKHKLLELALEPWTKNDILDWVVRYSGLSHTEPAFELLADTIFRATAGLPTLVAHELLSRCVPASGR
jgi:hypothetical protein